MLSLTVLVCATAAEQLCVICMNVLKTLSGLLRVCDHMLSSLEAPAPFWAVYATAAVQLCAVCMAVQWIEGKLILKMSYDASRACNDCVCYSSSCKDIHQLQEQTHHNCGQAFAVSLSNG